MFAVLWCTIPYRVISCSEVVIWHGVLIWHAMKPGSSIATRFVPSRKAVWSGVAFARCTELSVAWCTDLARDETRLE